MIISGTKVRVAMSPLVSASIQGHEFTVGEVTVLDEDYGELEEGTEVVRLYGAGGCQPAAVVAIELVEPAAETLKGAPIGRTSAGYPRYVV